jgi:type II secretory pathway component PulK
VPVRRHDAGEEGVVLLLVLIVIVVTIISVYAFARTSLLEVVGLRQSAEHARAEVLARSGVAIAWRALADDLVSGADEDITTLFETQADAWAVLGRRAIEVPGGSLELRVRDSGSRMNLNALVDNTGERHSESALFLTAALERIIEGMPGRPEEKPYKPEELAEAILDWIDADDLTRLGDTEADSYAAKRARGRPVNRPVFSLSELAGAPDVDARLLAELELYFTPYPLFPMLENGGVNPNTAPPHVLGLIYFGTADDKRLVTREDVFRVIRAREEGRVFCLAESDERCVTFASEIGRVGETMFPPLQLASDVFTIESRARLGSASVTVRSTVDREDLEAPSVLEYGIE